MFVDPIMMRQPHVMMHHQPGDQESKERRMRMDFVAQDCSEQEEAHWKNKKRSEHN
jgi:hypothetical protein